MLAICMAPGEKQISAASFEEIFGDINASIFVLSSVSGNYFYLALVDVQVFLKVHVLLMAGGDA